MNIYWRFRKKVDRLLFKSNSMHLGEQKARPLIWLGFLLILINRVTYRLHGGEEAKKGFQQKLKTPDISGTPGGIRTPDLWIRSPALYPAELRAHRCLKVQF
jgi:hypothetical protein